MTLSDNLKKSRKSAHLTQSQVAKKLHVSRKTISGWENAHSTPDIVNISKLSDVYHVSLDCLIRESDLSKFEKDKSVSYINLKKIYRITCFLNYFSIFLLYIELFRPYGFHSLVIPIFSIINGVFFVSSFPNWSALKNRLYLLKTFLIFVFAFTLNIFANLLDVSFLKYFHSSSITFLFGLATGRIILITLISFCFLSLFLNHSSKKALYP